MLAALGTALAALLVAVFGIEDERPAGAGFAVTASIGMLRWVAIIFAGGVPFGYDGP